MWVSIDARDGSFEWCRRDGRRHAVDDPEGAARRIATDVWRSSADRGEKTEPL
ncbi:hypothetical protein [Actinoallomurus acaciae]|uniref:Uncharacterized protein n=1 Tax=Actinoallomurus acaciae TaxID=502577 RepID=A0ABV5YBY3_9ACTN